MDFRKALRLTRPMKKPKHIPQEPLFPCEDLSVRQQPRAEF
jgi:hypothetical protein